MSDHSKKAPAPYTATTPDPGAKPNADGSVAASQAWAAWVRADLDFKASQPQPDYSKGNGSGINNG